MRLYGQITDEEYAGAGPVHWRWFDARYWQWVTERIAWLDEEARKTRERKAEQEA